MVAAAQADESTSYRHLVEIASGGMGRVHIAVRGSDPAGELYAVKRLHPHLVGDPRARATLEDEARLLGDVHHPNLLRVLEAGEDDRGPFLAMEYVNGVSLAELRDAVRRVDEEMPLGVCIEVALQVAHGLAAMHEATDAEGGSRGLVHRDVSPHNVLLGWDGVVRVADFGIAIGHGRSAQTSTGVLKGKAGYMAPEQLRFEEPDGRADLFAMGVVLFELLAGRRLYSGSEGSEAARRILREPPPDVGDDREDAPAPVVELLFELLAKDPDGRPASARVAAKRLEATLREIRESEGSIDLGKYARSFFETERADRLRLLEAARRRTTQVEQIKTRFGPLAQSHREPRAWRVKGAAVLSTVEYLISRFGAEGYARVLATTDERTQSALEKQVLVSSWYDGEVMISLTDAAERLFGGDEHELAGAIGAASAEFAFGEGGPYEIFRTRGIEQGMGAFMDSTEAIYRLYYDQGEWEVVRWSSEDLVVHITDGGVFPASIVRRIAGYLKRGLELLGASDVRTRVERGEDDLVIAARWPRVERPGA
ncbi:MAG: serine/threonine protein kinase [Deltaproteobacteria bacterium]|nr:serine/threonine protein kinase [Deltaproteobacteria bacterium]